MEEIYLVRKPIFNKKQEVAAYELLFRYGGNMDMGSDSEKQNKAVSEAVLNAFTGEGLENITGSHLTFINLDKELLGTPLKVPNEKLVVEVAGGVFANEELIQTLQRLAEEGHTIALNDFKYSEALRPVVELADVVKLNVMSLDEDELRFNANKLKEFSAKTLADNVESYEDFELCSELEFDYYQGFFLSKPRLVKGRKIAANRVVVLRLLGEMQDPEITPERIVELLSQDARLGYKLLRIVNSAAYSLPRQIESLKETIILLGIAQLKAWTSLIALSNVENKPHELVNIAMIRARMCEYLARSLDHENPDSFFTVGMFSTLDAVLDAPMEDVLKELPLAAPLKDALLERKGIMGDVLEAVVAYERADWDNMAVTGLDANNYREAYISSVEWANTAAAALH